MSTHNSREGEQIATIIMQAIAPYHKPYKYLGEKSIETAKNEIMQSFHQELQKAREEAYKQGDSDGYLRCLEYYELN